METSGYRYPVILLREVLGEELRRRRLAQGRTLREVSADAMVSLGYLSELERGEKEASSELLSAVCAALDVSLSELMGSLGQEIAEREVMHVRAAAA